MPDTLKLPPFFFLIYREAVLRKRFLISFVLLFFPLSIFAGDQNYQNYVVGENAAGMGGAYTAFSETADGTFYNPGGIVFSSEDRVSLSANIFRYTKGRIKNGVAVDTVRKDVPLSSINIIPASSVGLYTFDFERDKKKKSDKPWNAFALSFYVPDSVLYSGEVQINEGGLEGLYTYKVDDYMFFIGPSYARRLTDKIGIGASLFYTYRRFNNENFITAKSSTNFVHNYLNNQYNYGGLLAIFGLKWRFSPDWHFGLSVRPSSFRLHGSGDSFRSNATGLGVSGTNPDNSIYQDLRVNLPRPMKVTGGIGFRPNKKLALGGDVSTYLPNDFIAVSDPQGRVGSATLKQEWVFNGNVGVEYRYQNDYPIRTGFFTNFSSAPTLGSTGSNNSKIDYYGGSLSFSVEKERYTSMIGGQVSYGKGNVLVANAINNFSLLHLTLMLGSSFRF